jgi:hypothetical protein
LASSSIDIDDNSTASITKTGRRGRTTHSDVWMNMEEVKKIVEGKEVRVAATCNYYKIPPLYSFYGWYWPFALAHYSLEEDGSCCFFILSIPFTI